MTSTVLIVEDDDLNLRLFAEVLRIGGHEIVTARSAAEAQKRIAERRPDIVMMDLHLPGGPSGWDCARWIKSDPDLRSIPVVAVSALTGSIDRELAREAGCDAFIAKPVAPDHLLETLGKLLEMAEG